MVVRPHPFKKGREQNLNIHHFYFHPRFVLIIFAAIFVIPSQRLIIIFGREERILGQVCLTIPHFQSVQTSSVSLSSFPSSPQNSNDSLNSASFPGRFARRFREGPCRKFECFTKNFSDTENIAYSSGTLEPEAERKRFQNRKIGVI